MIKNNTPSKQDSRRGTPRLNAVVSRFPLIVVVACVVAAFGGNAREAQEQHPADKTFERHSILRIVLSFRGTSFHLSLLSGASSAARYTD